MAKAPRFIADTRAGANIGAFQTPGGADVGASLAGLGGNVSDAGFDQLTRQAVSEAQIEGRKAGEEGGLTGQEPAPVAGTIAGQAYNAAARNSFVRAQSRKETIDTIRATSGFALAAEQERERMMDEGDVTDPAAAEQYASFLENQQNELLSTSTMSDFGKQRLQAQLESYKMDFSGRFGKRVSEAQKQLVGRSAMKAIQGVTARAMRDPSDIVGRFRELDDSLDVLAPGMDPDEEIAYRDNGRQQIIKTSVSRLLAGGDVRGARRLIDETPGLIETMDPGEQRVILGGILAAEKAQQSTGSSMAAKLSEIEGILGRPLTESEKLKKLGLGGGGQSMAAKIADIESVVGKLSPSQKAAVVGVSRTALTDPGKHLQDRQMFIEQFGEGSEQVNALDEAASAKGDPGFKLSDVSSARKEFTALSKDFVKVRDAVNRVEASAKNPSPAGDLALIFNYMKILDPGSTVREGEFATASNSGGIDSRVRNMYNKVISGERLDDKQRLDFIGKGRDLAAAQLKTQLQLEKEYTGIAENAGLPANQVIVDFVGDMRGPEGVHSLAKEQLESLDEKSPLAKGAAKTKQADPAPERIQIDLEGNVIGGTTGGGF